MIVTVRNGMRGLGEPFYGTGGGGKKRPGFEYAPIETSTSFGGEAQAENPTRPKQAGRGPIDPGAGPGLLSQALVSTTKVRATVAASPGVAGRAGEPYRFVPGGPTMPGDTTPGNAGPAPAPAPAPVPAPTPAPIPVIVEPPLQVAPTPVYVPAPSSGPAPIATGPAPGVAPAAQAVSSSDPGLLSLAGVGLVAIGALAIGIYVFGKK